MVEEPKTHSLRTGVSTDNFSMSEIPTYVTKSNFFRVIHIDGVYGGGTPTPGNIMMTVFNHRIPFPNKIVSDNNGNEVASKRDVKYGVEQEFEASLVMSLDTAKIMLTWLTSTIKNTEAATMEHKANELSKKLTSS